MSAGSTSALADHVLERELKHAELDARRSEAKSHTEIGKALVLRHYSAAFMHVAVGVLAIAVAVAIL